MTDDISTLARIAYDAGINPIDYAEEQVTLLIAVFQTLSEAGDEFGAAVTTCELTAPSLARRILGNLLDAGWKTPEVASAKA